MRIHADRDPVSFKTSLGYLIKKKSRCKLLTVRPLTFIFKQHEKIRNFLFKIMCYRDPDPHSESGPGFRVRRIGRSLRIRIRSQNITHLQKTRKLVSALSGGMD
jgi:hypothetical protein